MKDWFLSREPREQVLISIMLTMIGLLVLWFLILSPVLSAKSEAATALTRAQNDYRMVARAAPALSGGKTATATETFNRQVLINLARTQDIRLTRVQPENNGDVSVWVDDIETQRLYRLLETLLTRYKVEMNRAAISTSPEGLLSAQFTLTPK